MSELVSIFGGKYISLIYPKLKEGDEPYFQILQILYELGRLRYLPNKRGFWNRQIYMYMHICSQGDPKRPWVTLNSRLDSNYLLEYAVS